MNRLHNIRYLFNQFPGTYTLGGCLLIMFIVMLSGFIAGKVFYRHNFENHLEIVSAEADAILALSSSYVSTYSRLLSHRSHEKMPVPAAFRAQAARTFNDTYDSDERFTALMVGMPDRYITTAPTDNQMNTVLADMASRSAEKYSELIDWHGKAVMRTIYPSIATEESCVNCHNTIQNPVTPWVIGDQLGAYVIDRGVQATKNRYLSLAMLTGTLVSLVLLTAYIVFRQQQNLKQQALQLKTITLTDPLTNCLNRRGLKEQERIITSETKGSVAMLALDIDHFKKINDVHGHEAGDQVLIWFAKIVGNQLRNNDVLARTGGEEFVIYLSNVSEEVAEKIAARICNRVASTPVILNNLEIQITVSIGAIHMKSATAQLLESVSRKTDASLYIAKKLGRNRVVWSDEEGLIGDK